MNLEDEIYVSLTYESHSGSRICKKKKGHYGMIRKINSLPTFYGELLDFNLYLSYRELFADWFIMIYSSVLDGELCYCKCFNDKLVYKNKKLETNLELYADGYAESGYGEANCGKFKLTI